MNILGRCGSLSWASMLDQDKLVIFTLGDLQLHLGTIHADVQKDLGCKFISA